MGSVFVVVVGIVVVVIKVPSAPVVGLPVSVVIDPVCFLIFAGCIGSGFALIDPKIVGQISMGRIDSAVDDGDQNVFTTGGDVPGSRCLNFSHAPKGCVLRIVRGKSCRNHVVGFSLCQQSGFFAQNTAGIIHGIQRSLSEIEHVVAGKIQRAHNTESVFVRQSLQISFGLMGAELDNELIGDHADLRGNLKRPLFVPLKTLRVEQFRVFAGNANKATAKHFLRGNFCDSLFEYLLWIKRADGEVFRFNDNGGFGIGCWAECLDGRGEPWHGKR